MFPCEFVRIFVRTRSDTPTYCTCSNWSWPKSLHFAIFSSSLTKKPTSWQMIDMKIKEQGKIVVIESFLHFCNAISYIGYIVRADSVEEWWKHWLCIPKVSSSSPSVEDFSLQKTSVPSCICSLLHLSSVPIWCGLEKNMLWQRPE